MSSDELEDQLRELLRPVELVCNADIPDDLVALAEEAIRPHVNSSTIETMAWRRPASLATYFVIRGSERYTRNSLWPQLGVTEQSSRAGETFLRSLGQLGLPTFQREVAAVSARRFVAPLLVHGAFPAAAAARFAERVQQEMRRGLTGGAEARRRLLADRDIELVIRRPAMRLLEWVPVYADDLLEAVIEHIERPTESTAARLPRHIAEALDRNAEATRGLTRLRPPVIRFELWQDYGPEVVAVQAGWYVKIGEATRYLQPDDAAEVSPTVTVSSTREGRESVVWRPQPVWFFTDSGQLIGADEPLPKSCVALLPRARHLLNDRGDRVPEVEEGYPLALDWSGYRSCRLDLQASRSIHLNQEPERSWSVVTDDRLAVVGDTVAHALAADGAPVYSGAPAITAPGVSDRVMLTFRVDGGSVFTRSAAADDAGVVQCDAVMPEGAVSGTLSARTSDGRRLTQRLVVVPGLTVAPPEKPLGPAATGEVLADADTGMLESTEIAIPPQATTVGLPVAGLPSDSVQGVVPRVQWGIHSHELGRLELASGAIESTPEALTSASRWLIVRYTRATEVEAALKVGGAIAQHLPSRRTRSSGPDVHRVALPIDPLADTIRSNQGLAMELAIVVDGAEFTAIEIGGVTGHAARTFEPTRQRSSTAPQERSPFADLPWLAERRNDTRTPDDHLVERLTKQIAGAGPVNSVVSFLRVLGHARIKWLSESDARVKERELNQLFAVADAMWRLDGVWYRVFAGHDLRSRFKQRARTHRDRLRRLNVDDRNIREQWLLGRVPAFDRLDNWSHTEWIELALPDRSQAGIQWIPAVALFYCLALVAGDDESGPVIAEIAILEPELLLETVTLVLRTFSSGRGVTMPTFTLRDSDEDAGEGVDLDEPNQSPAPAFVPTGPPAAIEDCTIEVSDRVLRITPPPGTTVPGVRVSSARAAEFVAPGRPDPTGTIQVTLPDDLSGEYSISVIDGSLLRLGPTPGFDIKLDDRGARPPRTPSPTATTLDAIADLQLRGLIEDVRSALGAGQLHAESVSELFDDERAGARALVRYAALPGSSDLDSLAVACLPTSFIFSSLGVARAELSVVMRKSRLLYACLAPRSSDAWRALGWPAGIRFNSNGAVDAFVGYVRDQQRAVHATTMRYSNAASLPNYELIARAAARLDSSGVDTPFLDLVTATHRMLTVAAVEPEAMRMVLSALRSSPDAAARAVLAGTALALITNY